jgi:hypothetical protein
MKSRTLIDVCQWPGRKPRQKSPSLDSFFRAALPFMTTSPRPNGLRRMSDLAIHAGAVATGAQSHLMRIGNGARVPMLIYVKPGVAG